MPSRLAAIFVACLCVTRAAADPGPTLDVEVDARDLPRKLLHTRRAVPCQPGPLRLWYPKWIPGSHGPYGRIEDVGGLSVETDAGKPLAWKRDDVELNCVACDVPAGVAHVVVRLDTICNVVGPHAIGVYSYGNRHLGVINWNTCLLYPEGPAVAEVRVNLTLGLPPGWRFASSLAVANETGSRVAFRPVPLTDLVDSPLIAGEHLRSYKLDTGPYPAASLDLVAESAEGLKLDKKVVEKYGRVVREACALFGAAHYPEFHFLVTCSDDLGYFGLEHHHCSLNGVKEHDLNDDARRRGWVANLLPHEYVHSWCGKYRRPAGLIVRDFHTPQKTKLVWVYEGLTEYLGEVLLARSGLASAKEYREMLAVTVGDQLRRAGRKWRSLEDTAVAAHVLRAPTRFWGDLRRDQDFYTEGALLWWEVDVTLRNKTNGKHTLDDFCKRFMGPIDRPGKVVPFELPEVVAVLKGLADHDWDAFFARRVSAPLLALPLDVVQEAGYRVEYGKKPSSYQEFLDAGAVSARDSLGLTFAADGSVTGVVPGMVGDKSGLTTDVQVVAVNRRKFGREALAAGLEAGVKSGKVEFLVLQGEEYRTVVLTYAGGPRFLQLVRDGDRPDVLADILKPTAGGKPAAGGKGP